MIEAEKMLHPLKQIEMDQFLWSNQNQNGHIFSKLLQQIIAF